MSEIFDFNSINNLNWKRVLHDSGSDNWQNHWFLDGENARVYNHKEHGMEVYTGARMYNNADHAVLWTKDVFKGDVKISYDYTRIDNAEACVNIIYILATGKGEEPFSKDISKWSDLRKVPSMGLYFNHMNTYHVSYAAFRMPEKHEEYFDYIRARRYNCGGLNGTDISPDYFPEDFFAPMEKHRMTVIKKGDMLYLHIKWCEKEKLCSWKLTDGGELSEGRIGLRQMHTRNSRYANIEISIL